jgi:hypothetical protein
MQSHLQQRNANRLSTSELSTEWEKRHAYEIEQQNNNTNNNNSSKPQSQQQPSSVHGPSRRRHSSTTSSSSSSFGLSSSAPLQAHKKPLSSAFAAHVSSSTGSIPTQSITTVASASNEALFPSWPFLQTIQSLPVEIEPLLMRVALGGMAMAAAANEREEANEETRELHQHPSPTPLLRQQPAMQSPPSPNRAGAGHVGLLARDEDVSAGERARRVSLSTSTIEEGPREADGRLYRRDSDDMV